MKKNVLQDFFQKLFFRRRLVLVLLIIPLIANTVTAQTISVSGVVKDEQAFPLPGVAVSIKGTTGGAVTNQNGEYKLNVSPTATLVFNYLGFTSQEVAVSNRTSIMITMREDISKLDEVIVVGYGIQTKREIAGAISSISAKTIEERVPVSIFDVFQGAAAGVRVASDSGAPGEESSINIRGVSSVSEAGGVPLYVVDGIIVDNINGISPNDIQSIEILKDAASAAIYGARSANGVILISTKRGDEGKPKINFGYTNSYSNLAHKLPQANRLVREVYDQSTLPTRFGLYPERNDSTAYNRNNDFDYQDLITKTGIRSQYDLNISGGSKNLTYYTGVQYLNNSGIILSSEEKRVTFRTNVDYKPNPKTLLATRLTFGYTDANLINDGESLSQALQRPAFQALYLPDGTPIFNNGGRRHPIETTRLRQDRRGRYNGVIGQIFEYDLSKAIRFHVDGSATLDFRNNRQFISGFLTNAPSFGAESIDRVSRLQFNSYVNLKKTFSKVHNFTGQLGTSYDGSNMRSLSVRGTNFVTESVNTLNAISLLNPAGTGSDGSTSAILGFFARAGYNYKQRYIFNAVIRRDGSSKFGADNRFGNFPAFSSAWRFTDEKFMGFVKKILTDGKLRATWGIQGSEGNLGNFASRNLLVFGSTFYNGVSGVITNPLLGNSNLKWEEQTQSDVGLDLQFWGGRLSLEASYYQRITKDLISNSAFELPAEVGRTNNVFLNAGTIRNRGVELQLSGFPIRNTSKNISLNTNLFLGFNRNNITDLPGDEIIRNNLYIVREGQEVGRFFGYRNLGIYAYDESNAYTDNYTTRLIPQFQRDQNGNVVIGNNLKPVFLGYTLPNGTPYSGNVNRLTTSGATAKAGDVIWENLPDANGNLNGDIGIEDRQILGSGLPKLQVSLNNTFTYKRFTVSAFVYGSFGNKVYNSLARSGAQFSSVNTSPDPYVISNLWKYPGQITDVYSRNGALNNSRPGNSFFLEDGSFIRLQTVRLGYQIPDKYSKKVYISNLSIFAFSNNLATWTKYSGFDPEVGQRNVLEPGNDNGRFPRRREFGFGLNASF
ncbi:MAG: SusC/RagA family TonB-linked outer membrane protein [Oligoflexus sp.]|nr:SusC/RagA family TonB-linked outer membrane protein [Pseudopedobacter sp.]